MSEPYLPGEDKKQLLKDSIAAFRYAMQDQPQEMVHFDGHEGAVSGDFFSGYTLIMANVVVADTTGYSDTGFDVKTIYPSAASAREKGFFSHCINGYSQIVTPFQELAHESPEAFEANTIYRDRMITVAGSREVKIIGGLAVHELDGRYSSSLFIDLRVNDALRNSDREMAATLSNLYGGHKNFTDRLVDLGMPEDEIPGVYNMLHMSDEDNSVRTSLIALAGYFLPTPEEFIESLGPDILNEVIKQSKEVIAAAEPKKKPRPSSRTGGAPKRAKKGKRRH